MRSPVFYISLEEEEEDSVIELYLSLKSLEGLKSRESDDRWQMGDDR